MILSLNAAHDCACDAYFLYVAFDQARYCSSLTFSIQSTVLPSSCSWMAMCVMAVVAVAPCQCFSPGGNQITSPGRMPSIGPPQRCARPQPAVTIRVWPSGWVCQAVIVTAGCGLAQRW